MCELRCLRWHRGRRALHGLKCHHAFDVDYDGSNFEKKIDLSEQFLYLIARTLLRRVEQGIITVKGYKP